MYGWAVIGAGPAGIATVGKLIDHGVPTKEILWIDPRFSVGDLGQLWSNIPSNTKVKLFLKFLRASSAFDYKQCPPEKHQINSTNPETTCRLSMIVEPLQWVTENLLKKVVPRKDIAESIYLKDRNWHISFRNSEEALAKNIILAIGAEPKKLSYSHPSIPIEEAMDDHKIKHHLEKTDKIAIFGSSHSAILALRNLCNNNVNQIINFYRSPLRYAVYFENWILFDDTGLKGEAAEWARQNIDGDMPENLIRVYANQENIEHYLPQCNKVIYAIGFEARSLPIIKNLGHVTYQERCGIIAPGLFGLGIAFPEVKANRFNILEYRVGLWKFIEYLHDVLPIWFNYPA